MVEGAIPVERRESDNDCRPAGAISSRPDCRWRYHYDVRPLYLFSVLAFELVSFRNRQWTHFLISSCSNRFGRNVSLREYFDAMSSTRTPSRPIWPLKPTHHYKFEVRPRYSSFLHFSSKRGSARSSPTYESGEGDAEFPSLSRLLNAPR